MYTCAFFVYMYSVIYTSTRFVFADALHVAVVNATVVNISWTNETLYNKNSSDILQQNVSAYTVQFR